MIRWTEDAAPGHPYWWDAAPPDPSSDQLPARVDVLVIGAGFTGLSAAIAAHDAGASVAVVDAGIPAAAASSLNGGMFGAHPRLPWEQLAKAYGEEVADGIFAEARPALEFAKDLIAREGIDCDLTQTGRIQLAWTESHFANQKRLASHVAEKSGVAVEVVEREGLSDEIATDCYYGGLLFPEHCAVHPGKYAQGLLKAVRARGVPVVAHAEVTRLERVEGFLALTPKGEVRARKVILATNGYTTPAFRALQARVFPLPSFLIATEPLPSNLLGHLAPGRRMMVETRARHSYFRLSPDGTRILYGGRSSMRPVDLKVAAARLHQTMCEVWPELEDVALSHVWTGNTGYSFGHMPHLGEEDGLHYALAYSGSGTVLAPYLGAKAAWAALGDDRAKTAYSKTVLKPSWLHPLSKPWFLYPADLWYRFAVDPKETKSGRGTRL